MNASWINPRVWHQFLVVAEELHFGRAAKRMNMTQPPLTLAIRQLEETLQASLFARTSRSVELTEIGKAIVPMARRLVAMSQALPAHAQAMASGQLGTIRLAFVSPVSVRHLPNWIKAFRRENAGITFDLTEATSNIQQKAILRGDIDAGLVIHARGFAPPGLEALTVARERFHLAMFDRHEFATRQAIELSDLLQQPVIIFPRKIEPSVYDSIVGFYSENGSRIVIAQEAIQMQTIVNLVWGELGFAWVPESVTEFYRTGVTYRDPGDLHRDGIRLDRAAVPEFEVSLIWDGSTSNVSLLRLIDFMARAGSPAR